MNKTAIIALGGNLGEIFDSFNYACKRMDSIGQIMAKSNIYSTKAVGGPPNQPDYLNAVVALSTKLEAPELLNFLNRTEVERGRVRNIKWGPRTLDLDILDYDSQVINTENLILPHPRMWERAFVLLPLSDIAAEYTHPVIKQSIKDRLKELNSVGVDKTKLTW